MDHLGWQPRRARDRGWQRRIARQRGLRAPRTGAITFVLLVPDSVFVDDNDRLAFAPHPVPTSADVLAILDRIVRRIARRLADEACDDRVEDIDVLAQVQAEAAATWRSPHNGKPTVRGVERLRAWCLTSPSRSLHAGVMIADHDREALERLCRYGTRPAFAHDRLVRPRFVRSSLDPRPVPLTADR